MHRDRGGAGWPGRWPLAWPGEQVTAGSEQTPGLSAWRREEAARGGCDQVWGLLARRKEFCPVSSPCYGCFPAALPFLPAPLVPTNIHLALPVRSPGSTWGQSPGLSRWFGKHAGCRGHLGAGAQKPGERGHGGSAQARKPLGSRSPASRPLFMLLAPPSIPFPLRWLSRLHPASQTSLVSQLLQGGLRGPRSTELQEWAPAPQATRPTPEPRGNSCPYSPRSGEEASWGRRQPV